MVDFALVLPPEPNERWELARQVGVEHAVLHNLELGDGRRSWDYDTLLRLKNRYASHGLTLSVLEEAVPVTDTTKLGLAGRDEEIAEFKQFLRDMGAVGIPVVCFDWMAGIRWARTATDVPVRGEALSTAYDDAQMRRGPVPKVARNVTHEDLWENLEYFLEEVVPVAEEAGVYLGLHPDDPPRESVRGMPRIIDSVGAYERVLDIVDSPHNGITFCQGNFRLMTDDLPGAIRQFGDRINFVHFRDVAGDSDGFTETFHDDGPTDMAACMAAYEEVGFDGPMRPDHVPTMAGEDNSNPGYHTQGRLFAIGYMKGVLEAATG
jgi:mannonate dehydratase